MHKLMLPERKMRKKSLLDITALLKEYTYQGKVSIQLCTLIDKCNSNTLIFSFGLPNLSKNWQTTE